MKIRAGSDISFEVSQATPMIVMLTVHPSRTADLLTDHRIDVDPRAMTRDYLDQYGNVCTRLVAPPGGVRLRSEFLISDCGLPDPVDCAAPETPIEQLPDDILIYLVASRYCDTEKLSDMAWSLFGQQKPGWSRVQAICDYVHDRISFGYQHARADRTASEGHKEKIGVCRDFAHLAIALCRCMNIPARYCTGYLGDIGVPSDPAPMDFSAWFEVFLDGKWYTLDARHNAPRIGRILIARGRDAADVAIATYFGPATLKTFNVTTLEVVDGRQNENSSGSHRRLNASSNLKISDGDKAAAEQFVDS